MIKWYFEFSSSLKYLISYLIWFLTFFDEKKFAIYFLGFIENCIIVYDNKLHLLYLRKNNTSYMIIIFFFY